MVMTDEQERELKLACQIGFVDRLFGVKRTPEELKKETKKYLDE